MRLMRVLCILALVVAVALPVYAEVQNVKVSGDMLIRGVTRRDYDFLKDSVTGGNQDRASLYNTATRVKIDADLTDNVATAVRLVNERDWDVDTAAANDINLDLANVTLKELIYSPLTVTLGRQDIKIGSGLVIADRNRPNWGTAYTGPDGTLTAGFGDLTVRKAFDAIKGTLDYDKWSVDGVIIKVNETGAVTDDDDIYGVNATYKFDNKYNSAVDGYFIADKNDAFNRQITSTGSNTIRTYELSEVFVVGTKGTIDPIESLNLKGEVAYQFGAIKDSFITNVGDAIVDSSGDSRVRSAWAVDVDGSYSWKDAKWTPNLGLGYSFRSGEESANDGEYELWEPLFTDQVRGEIAKVTFNGANAGNTSNCHIVGGSLGVKPIEKLLVKLDYYHTWLDEKLAETATRSDKTGLADEVDLGLAYNYTEDVTFGLLGAVLVPSNSFKGNADDTAYETIGSVKVNF